MSHPNPHHDRANEYPYDMQPASIKRTKSGAKSKALKRKLHPIAKTIKQLEHKEGEAPLAKLKRLLK